MAKDVQGRDGVFVIKGVSSCDSSEKLISALLFLFNFGLPKRDSGLVCGASEERRHPSRETTAGGQEMGRKGSICHFACALPASIW